jgi:lysine-N-methylase
VSQDPAALPPPSWIGRILFRQALALYSRKDQGPNRGRAVGHRLALFAAALRFVRGSGSVPRLHGWLPETTFEQVEIARSPLSEEAERILERYYCVKVDSLHFCGAAFYGLASLWDGFEALAITFPVILWISRMFTGVSRAEAVTKALSIVDDHFGFNRLLRTARQRLNFRILARRGELEKLIAWYGR